MPDDKRPLKVFLCHAHADREAVRALYNHLVKDGVDAWLDKEKLLGGADWEYEIRKAVRESDVVIVCHSQQFNQRGFRQKEVKIALEEADLLPKGEIFIIPVRLEECDVLDDLKRWHWVDLFETDGYERLMRALLARAEKIGATLQVKRNWLPKVSAIMPETGEGENKAAREKVEAYTNVLSTDSFRGVSEKRSDSATDNKKGVKQEVDQATGDKPIRLQYKKHKIAIISFIIVGLISLGILAFLVLKPIRPIPLEMATITIDLSQSATATYTLSETPHPTTVVTKQYILTMTPTVTLSTNLKSATPSQTKFVNSECDQAQFITDVNVPDGTIFSPGEAFTKTWRLRNVGTCTWNSQYTVVFSSGNQMSGPNSQPLSVAVAPNQTIDISLNLVAPSAKGVYTGYWKLINPSGEMLAQFFLEIRVN